MNSVLNRKVRNFFTYNFSFTVVRGTFSLLALVQACFFQVFSYVYVLLTLYPGLQRSGTGPPADG